MRDRERAVALSAAAALVGVATTRGAGRRADHAVFRMANRGGRGAADAAMRSVTELGSIWASVGAAVVLAATGRRNAATRALSAAGLTWALGQGLKKLFRRPRPYDTFEPGTARLLIGKPRGTSWPSSHPAVLLAFITVAERELSLGPGMRAAGLGLAGLVGASRSYLGVHFPSDVAGGLLLGRAVGLAWPGATRPDASG
ncbi:MAG: phosphatase PAP2 family protein [Actinomycetota bacterium]